jgi:hypothetical protein
LSIVVLALILFLVMCNLKDEKELNGQLKNNFRKPGDEKGDRQTHLKRYSIHIGGLKTVYALLKKLVFAGKNHDRLYRTVWGYIPDPLTAGQKNINSLIFYVLRTK